MKLLVIINLLVAVLVLISCDTLDNVIPECGSPDPVITFEDADAQFYEFRTPLYGMMVAVRGDVGGNVDNILNKLDNRAANFLECQFGNPDVGFEDVKIESGEIIPPLSEQRVFVVPFSFDCPGPSTNPCAGVYFGGPGADLTIISKSTIGKCSDFSFFKHELGHRYGMQGDHSNQGAFQPCIDPPECDIPVCIGG